MIMPATINDVPITCINQAAVTYHVPATLILSIMKKENGRNGQAVPNKNGSYDIGVCQINSRWLPTLARYGYTRDDIQFNPCKNVMAASWILAPFWPGRPCGSLRSNVTHFVRQT
jgi:soluble lytic murein transglycosylase-like protein